MLERAPLTFRLLERVYAAQLNLPTFIKGEGCYVRLHAELHAGLRSLELSLGNSLRNGVEAEQEFQRDAWELLRRAEAAARVACAERSRS